MTAPDDTTTFQDMDAACLEDLQTNGEQALARVFMQYRNQLMRMVEFRLDRRLMTRLDVDDILQETYLVLAKRLRGFSAEPAVPVFVWLRTIAQQVVVDNYRRHLGAQKRDARMDVALHRRAGAGSTSISIAARLADSMTSPSKAAARADMREFLQSALEEMAPVDREILALRHFEELSNGEAALILGLSPAAASNRYTRALKRLGKIMTEARAFEQRLEPRGTDGERE